MITANQTFLISGGASGLGAGCVKRLAQEKANVVIADVNAVAGEALAAELGERAADLAALMPIR